MADRSLTALCDGLGSRVGQLLKDSSLDKVIAEGEVRERLLGRAK